MRAMLVIIFPSLFKLWEISFVTFVIIVVFSLQMLTVSFDTDHKGIWIVITFYQLLNVV